MKQTITILFFLTLILPALSQTEADCSKIGVEEYILSGDLYEYETLCYYDVKIIADFEDTFIYGNTIIKAINSLKIVPTGEYRISIVPQYYGELINLYSIDRSNEGTVIDEDKEEPELSLYPNPAETTLTIETALTIVSYIIKDAQGVVYLEGSTPENNILSVSVLQTGLYYITIGTINETIQKQFFKN